MADKIKKALDEAQEITRIQDYIDNIKQRGFHVGNISDGHHTFDELYDHRAKLFLSLCLTSMHNYAWKSLLHNDPKDPMYPGMFIVGVTTPEGEATYHYDIDPYWSMFNVREVPRAPKYDGCSPKESIDRLVNFAKKMSSSYKYDNIVNHKVTDVVNNTYNEYTGYAVPNIGHTTAGGSIVFGSNEITNKNVSIFKDTTNKELSTDHTKNQKDDLYPGMTFIYKDNLYTYRGNGLIYDERYLNDLFYIDNDGYVVRYLNNNVDKSIPVSDLIANIKKVV